ncbi:hypothetical protein ABKN59_009033 [Abortiporus biennis]
MKEPSLCGSRYALYREKFISMDVIREAHRQTHRLLVWSRSSGDQFYTLKFKVQRSPSPQLLYISPLSRKNYNCFAPEDYQIIISQQLFPLTRYDQPFVLLFPGYRLSERSKLYTVRVYGTQDSTYPQWAWKLEIQISHPL